MSARADLSAALTALSASVSALDDAANDYLAANPSDGDTDTQYAAIMSQVNEYKTRVDNVTAKLAPAAS